MHGESRNGWKEGVDGRVGEMEKVKPQIII